MIFRTLMRISVYVFTLILILSIIPQQAHAAELDLGGTNSYAGTSGVAMPINDLYITGNNASTTPVKLRVTNGTLSMSVTTGLTFDGASSGSTIYFSGTVENINNALDTLTYTRAGTGSDTLEVSLVTQGEVFFEDNGHLYKYISYNGTWNQAQTHAAGQTAYGATGYLTTITSQTENDFVAARLLNAGWMGASDAAVEGAWRWVTGPENGTQFWSGLSGGSTVGGNYANWGTGEPNDSGGEDCAQFLTGGSGKWNDLPCSTYALPGYVVEFGAPGALPTVTAKNISITTSALPTVNTLTPADNATSIATTSNLTMVFSQSVSTSTGTIAIRKTSDNTIFESFDIATSPVISGGGTNTIVINPTTDFAEGTSYYVIVPNTAFKNASDAFFAGITASTTWNFTIGDFTAPIISNLSSNPATTTATISWDTNEITSTKVVYGSSQAYGSSTSETDTSPRVLAHNVNLTGLAECATYFYKAVSRDAATNTATSTEGSFLTLGCQSGTTPLSATSTSLSTTAGGTTTLAYSDTIVQVVVPTNVTSTSSTIVIQINALTNTNIISDIGKPSSSLRSAGDIFLDIKAIIDSHTILDTFNSPITIVYDYDDSDIAGIDESTLKLYHYHESAWRQLDNCSVDVVANRITCTTSGFSIFGLFGLPVTTSGIVGGSMVAGGGVTFGCKDIKATNYNAFSSHRAELCRYAQDAVSNGVATAGSGMVSALGRDLSVGLTGPDVEQLQRFLIAQGFGISAGPTGYFGAQTRRAVIAFQKKHIITPAIGYFGPKTRGVAQSLGF